MRNLTSTYTRWKAGLALVLIIFAAQLLVLIPKTDAASLSSAYLRLNRLAQSQTTKGRLVFKTNNAGATALTIDMNGADSTTWSAQTGSVHAGTMAKDVATCATELSVTGLPGTLTITGASAHTISISGITALSASTTYCIDFTDADAFTTPTSGTYHPTITESSGATDSTTIATNIIGANADQVTVNASVSPSFSFSLQANSKSFASPLSAGGPSSTTALNATVSTNAASGWQMWAADLSGTPGLRSTIASKTIAYSPAAGVAGNTLSTGVEGYNVGNNAISGTTCGTPTYGNFYNGAVPTKGSGLDGTMRSVVSVTGAADTCNVPFVFNGSISNTTPAATDYSSTMTVVAAGNF